MIDVTAELRLVLLAAILGATLIGWLALWAGAGRFRWYWHITPLAVTLASLVPMGGRDPFLLFGMQAGTILICEAVRKRIATQRELVPVSSPVQFGIHDSIAAIALIGVLLAILRVTPMHTVPHHTISVSRWTYSGGGLGFATLAGVALVIGTRAIWQRLVVATLFSTAAATLLLFNDPKEAAFDYSLYGAIGIQWSYDWVLVLVPAQAAATAAWLVLLRGAGWAWWPVRPSVDTGDVSRTTSSPAPGIVRLSRFGYLSRLFSRVAVVLSTVWLVWVMATAYWLILPPFSVPTIELPSPNGADDLLAIDKQLKWSALPSTDVSLASEQQCVKFAAENQRQLDRIRESLGKPWLHVPDHIDFNKNFQYIHAMRDVAFALWANARAEAAQGRFDLAARDYLDMIHLANLSSLGGLTIEESVANAIAGAAQGELVAYLEQFDPPTLREIAYTIELLDGSHEPLETLQARDDFHTAIISGWLERLVNLPSQQGRGSVNSATATSRDRCDARLRLTALEAAIRAYALERGSPPDSLAALVPQYLTALPLDPFCQHEDATFVYRRDGDRYLLYSLGHDGYDDGGLRIGTPDPRRGKKEDLFFDSPLP